MPSYCGIMLGGHKVTNIFYQCNIFSTFFCDGTSKSVLRDGQVGLTDIEVIDLGTWALAAAANCANLPIGDSGISSLRIEKEGIILIAIMHTSGSYFLLINFHSPQRLVRQALKTSCKPVWTTGRPVSNSSHRCWHQRHIG